MKTKFYIITVIGFALFLASCAGEQKITRHTRETENRLKSKRNEFRLKARDYFLEGLFLEQEGRYNEALVRYYQALHHDSTSATIYNSIAENHLRLGHLESAEVLLRKALRLDPKNTESLALMAECQYRIGRDDLAIEYYRRLLAVDPYDDDSRQYLILLLEKNGDMAAVAKQNEQFLKLYGNDPAVMERVAALYFKQKQYDKALHYYRLLTKADSTRSRFYYLIGSIYEFKHQPDSAVVYFKRALHFRPDFSQALDRLTTIYRNQREWDKIINAYKPVLQADSSNRVARVLSAEAYFYLEKYDQARRLLRPFTEQKDVPLSILELMGRVEMESKHYVQAIDLFKRIIQQDEKNKYAWLFLAFTQSDMGAADSAEATYRRAVELFPDDAMLWSFYGITLQQQEKYQPAIRAFKHALSLEPDNRNALTNLPIVYESLGMYARCDSLYEVALKHYPDDPLLLNNFSYSLSERGVRLNEALKMAQKALQLKPREAAYLDTIGWIYYKLGDYAQAEKYIRESVDLRPDSGVVIEHLGDVYNKMGRTDRALEMWQKALQLNPDDQKLQEKINSLK
ncbi:MAG TPA: tetratricopeptide repeat protein [Caldithrix abyssi]|uniref:Tetratricopeptide repeat protein n=1 Tax=Caldithrix abyssi TaxID=187145 RepID=A0A7V5PQX3_CALAY|nr:tetratricopeptide repeat protein [Caldithrix abyssi]